MPSTEHQDTFTIEREGEEHTIAVTFDLDPGEVPSGLSGPPEFYDPGSGPEIHIVSAVFDGGDLDGQECELTDREHAEIEDEIKDNLDRYDADPGEPDDWRDE